MHKTLIIGDIHGCYAELQALLDKAGLGEQDTIISIGDFVDRGPETPQVADFFRTTGNARAIMGNHERKHVRAARHEVKLSTSQMISRTQFGPTYASVVGWMAELPLAIELPEALVVHGYFEPGVPLEKQHPSVLCGTMGGDKILRERYERPWYELYDGNKPVIVGHLNYTRSDQPFIYQDKVYGVDTDCVTGKCLTGILLPAFQFVSVPSRGNLWAQVHRSYSVKQPPPAQPRVSEPWSEAQTLAAGFLLEQLLEANRRLMLRMREIPGYADLSPRQQAKTYSEQVGQGAVANMLQLARQGKLDVEWVRKIVFDPQRLNLLLENVAALVQTWPSDQVGD